MNVVRGMIVILFGLLLMIVGCAPKYTDTVVLEVGVKKVTLGEYENFYTRNSGGWEVARKSTPEERERFLDLLTNYKLKLEDAYERGMQNDSDIVSELHGYRSSLASTFLIDREVTEPGVQQLYKRRQEEIRAEHILLRVAPDAPAEETLKVYTKAVDIIKQLMAGENFDSLALKYSEDPSVKQNHGDIYYFSGGVMYSQFENAAYSMKKGELSGTPVRTPFGYHIIKIIDRQPSRGSIRVSHIMARSQSQTPDSADTVSALARIKGIQDSLAHGWDFHKLAVKVSEDAGSAPQGGDLGWFERRRFVQPFDEAAFTLKAGQVSGIVRSPFGYHIILCDSAKPLPPYSQIRDELKKQYQQHRFNEDYAAYVDQMKRDFHYTFDDSSFRAFVTYLDSTKVTGDSAWADNVLPRVRMKSLMTLDNRPIPLDTVIAALGSRQEYRNTPLRMSELRTKVDRIAESFLFDAKSAGMEERYPEFGALMREYTDGIVLYKAEQTEVWNKTTVSDSALHDYYDQNKSKFMFPDRVNISVLTFNSDTLAYLVYDSLKHGADFNELLTRYPEETSSKSKDGSRGLQPVDTDTLTKQAVMLAAGECTEPLEVEQGTYAIAKLLAHEPAREKTFEEAGAEVSNQYQEYQSKFLEQQWLDRIKQRHPIKQFKEALKNAFSSPQASQ